MIWTEPAWIERAAAWIRSHVAVAGEIEQPHVRPWSTVMRVPTAGGTVWFKASMPLLAREAGVIEVLARRRPELVPQLLAVERRDGWMLQTDGGSRLREVAAGEDSRRFWAELLPLYAELQVEAAADVAALLAAGAPDRRLAALPELAKDVVGDAALVRHVARLAGELAALGLPETIQHDDFHDGNVFVRDGRYVFFDWGDSCVSHPFFTLVVTLGSIAYARGLSEDAPELDRLRDAYLEPWTRFAPLSELRRAFSGAYVLGNVARAVAWHELVAHLPPPYDEEYADAVRERVRRFAAAVA